MENHGMTVKNVERASKRFQRHGLCLVSYDGVVVGSIMKPYMFNEYRVGDQRFSTKKYAVDYIWRTKVFPKLLKKAELQWGKVVASDG